MPRHRTRFETLSTRERIVEFIACFKEASGIELPLAYCEGSRLVGAVGADERLVAGFVVAPGKSMLWPSILPEGARAQALRKLGRLARVCELNGVWAARERRNSPLTAELWLRVSDEIAGSGTLRVTFAVDLRKQGLVTLYEAISTGVVHEGPTNTRAVPDVRVYRSTPARFKRLPSLYRDELARRIRAEEKAAPPAPLDTR